MLLLLSCALNAWGQQMYFSMQVRKPAAIRVSPEARSALVLNSMQLTDPVRSCLFAMTQTLEEQERFDEVAVLPLSNGAASKTVASTKSAVEVVVKRALSVSQADSLCDLYGVDVLLVLNALLILDTDGSELMENNTWDAWREAYCTAQWSIHYKSASALSFTTTDTLVWESNNVSRLTALSALPDKVTVHQEIAAYEGEQMARRITPQWVTVDRYLYKNSHEDILSGLKAFGHQNRSEAIAAWQSAYDKTGKEKASKETETAAYAAADIALAMEMQDRYDEAITWTKRAIAVFRGINTPDAAQQVVNLQYYITQLQLRKNYMF